jgi:hypothetical protein
MEARSKRLLTLNSVSDGPLAQFSVARGSVTAPSYRCTDPSATLVPLAEVIGPDRRLNEGRSAKAAKRHSQRHRPESLPESPGDQGGLVGYVCTTIVIECTRVFLQLFLPR